VPHLGQSISNVIHYLHTAFFFLSMKFRALGSTKGSEDAFRNVRWVVGRRGAPRRERGRRWGGNKAKDTAVAEVEAVDRSGGWGGGEGGERGEGGSGREGPAFRMGEEPEALEERRARWGSLSPTFNFRQSRGALSQYLRRV